ncbi:unnamed protein product [Leuciscus chuanchicus]
MPLGYPSSSPLQLNRAAAHRTTSGLGAQGKDGNFSPEVRKTPVLRSKKCISLGFRSSHRTGTLNSHRHSHGPQKLQQPEISVPMRLQAMALMRSRMTQCITPQS